jgi:hypothetical protein
MSTFVVNAESLRALQSSMIGLAVEFESGDTVSSNYGEGSATDAAGQLKNPGQLNEADEALQPFYDAWENSLAVTGKMMVDLAKELGRAATNYQNTENAINTIFGDMLHPKPQPKPPKDPLLGPMLIGADPPPK